MAFISKSDLKPFGKAKLNLEDYRKLESITRVKKLKKGIGGYSGNQIRNFVLYGHYCSEEMKQEILNYFSSKKLIAA